MMRRNINFQMCHNTLFNKCKSKNLFNEILVQLKNILNKKNLEFMEINSIFLGNICNNIVWKN